MDRSVLIMLPCPCWWRCDPRDCGVDAGGVRYGGAAEQRHYAPSELSGGETTAHWFVGRWYRPALILADEPTGNLDPDISKLWVLENFNRIGYWC